MTSLVLPPSGDLFDPLADAIVDNLLICAAAHESGDLRATDASRAGAVRLAVARPLPLASMLPNLRLP